MKITQLDKSIEAIKKLDISEYCKVYFLILKTSKTKKGTDNYVFNSKRLGVAYGDSFLFTSQNLQSIL